MPVRPAIPDTAEFALQYSLAGEAVENIIHVDSELPGASWDNAALNGMAGVLKNWWVTHLQPILTPNVSLNRIVCLDIGVAGGGSRTVYQTGLPAAGTAVGSNLPNNDTIAISLRSTLAGRSYRGRLYHVGMISGMLDASNSNKLAAATLAGFVTIYTALMTEIAGHGVPGAFNLVIVSWKLHQKTLVDHIEIDQWMDSQRRRLPFHNRHR